MSDGIAIQLPGYPFQKLLPGDRVLVHNPGSWTDGKEMTVVRINTTSADSSGHLLQADSGQTIVPEFLLERIG